MWRLLNGARRPLVGRSMSQCLVSPKKVVIIKIGRLRNINISHMEIETQRESSFKGINPMQVMTSRSNEIKPIIALVVVAVQK